MSATRISAIATGPLGWGTDDELRQILKMCQRDKQAIRDQALILTLLDTGLGVGEMVLLEKKQLYLDPDGKTMWMLARVPKTKIVHYFFLRMRTSQAMQAYLGERNDQ